MKKIKSSQLVMVILSIIFGSAILILGYSLIMGKDLTKPPEFDLSAYDELKWGNPEELFRKLLVSEENNSNPGLSEKFIEKVSEEINNDYIFETRSIYFSQYFVADTAQKTRANLDNFILDFPELKIYRIVDLLEQKCYSVKMPVESREDIVEKLKADLQIEKIEVAAAPYYEVCFYQAKYDGEADVFLKNYGLNLDNLNSIPEYIAYLSFGDDVGKIKELLEKLKLDYSDVILVVE
jgi:hypothetical protein